MSIEAIEMDFGGGDRWTDNSKWNKPSIESYNNWERDSRGRGHFEDANNSDNVYMFATLWTYQMLPVVPIVLDIILPLNQTRQLIYLYETEYFVDPDKYYFSILIHAYVTMPVSVSIIIAFDTMFAVYVHHACGMFATLGSWLENIANFRRNGESEIAERSNGRRRDLIYEKIVECIKMHREAVEFAGLLDSSNSRCFLSVIAICVPVITLTGFMMVTNLDKPGEALRLGAYTMSEIIHLFYICSQGQLLIEHSEHIFVDAYNVDWTEISIRARRLLIVIMMRSSMPCRITAGKVYALSIENFAAALKTSMSYFTVLLSIHRAETD